MKNLTSTDSIEGTSIILPETRRVTDMRLRETGRRLDKIFVDSPGKQMTRKDREFLASIMDEDVSHFNGRGSLEGENGDTKEMQRSQFRIRMGDLARESVSSIDVGDIKKNDMVHIAFSRRTHKPTDNLQGNLIISVREIKDDSIAGSVLVECDSYFCVERFRIPLPIISSGKRRIRCIQNGTPFFFGNSRVERMLDEKYITGMDIYRHSTVHTLLKKLKSFFQGSHS